MHDGPAVAIACSRVPLRDQARAVFRTGGSEVGRLHRRGDRLSAVLDERVCVAGLGHESVVAAASLGGCVEAVEMTAAPGGERVLCSDGRQRRSFLPGHQPAESATARHRRSCSPRAPGALPFGGRGDERPRVSECSVTSNFSRWRHLVAASRGRPGPHGAGSAGWTVPISPARDRVDPVAEGSCCAARVQRLPRDPADVALAGCGHVGSGAAVCGASDRMCSSSMRGSSRHILEAGLPTSFDHGSTLPVRRQRDGRPRVGRPGLGSSGSSLAGASRLPHRTEIRSTPVRGTSVAQQPRPVGRPGLRRPAFQLVPSALRVEVSHPGPGPEEGLLLARGPRTSRSPTSCRLPPRPAREPPLPVKFDGLDAFLRELSSAVRGTGTCHPRWCRGRPTTSSPARASR